MIDSWRAATCSGSARVRGSEVDGQKGEGESVACNAIIRRGQGRAGQAQVVLERKRRTTRPCGGWGRQETTVPMSDVASPPDALSATVQ